MSEFGRKFDSLQRRYDMQEPPDDEKRCEQCGAYDGECEHTERCERCNKLKEDCECAE